MCSLMAFSNWGSIPWIFLNELALKASLNGVLNFSTYDGWWAEACEHGKNGWGVGNPENPNDYEDVNHLYELLEKEIINLYYEKRDDWITMMKNSIITGLDYTAYRMISQYDEKYYSMNKLENNH